ncbi:MAG TPA: hypothetical protein DD670_03390 [Planctomycetaceae bacterium]|nr:hypothetical protein [Planctomycetaceae bacterium]
MKFLNVAACVLVGVAVVASAETLRAESLPATEIAIKGGVGNRDFTLGWSFTPTEDFVVTHLGVFDIANNGIQNLDSAGGQQVRLFTLGGGYIADVVVPTQIGGAGEDAGSYGYDAYYAELAQPVTVTAGTVYLVAARVYDYTGAVTFDNDETRPFTRVGGYATPLNTPAMPNTATYGSGNSFTIVSNPSNFYGGTFKYEAVPEPTTACLLLVGMLGFALARNRRG